MSQHPQGTAAPRAAPRAPTVSVVMAVRNGARYLRQAVDSILAQSFSDLEFVIVDDGSTDNTAKILDSYVDPRLLRLLNRQNLGVTRSLNRGICASSGRYLARQDADDWSLPGRLAQQVDYLESNPQVALVGSGSRWVDEEGRLLWDWQPEAEPVQIHQNLLWSSPFVHGAFLLRRACLADVGGGYDESYPFAQDCDLLMRLEEPWDLANFPAILYVYRQHGGSISSHREVDQLSCLHRAQQSAIRRRLSYGMARLSLSRDPVPDWVRRAPRRWLARRFVWWSAAARQVSRQVAVRFLLLAFLLQPAELEIWSFAGAAALRKLRRRPAPSATR
jgi:glycosyltransferase involved in cell wall biosynthesis